MRNNILEKLEAIEKLVREVRQELLLNSNLMLDSAPVRDEILAHTISFFLDNEVEVEYNLDDMELKELKELAEELEIDLPRDVQKEEVIFAIMELYKAQTSAK
ncbi:hypothetical protein SPSYN_02510 [Sporotomaculum syntrophicum]|uniref:Rho termination factor-like N-terminal domain-containing protein n=1 Tax=Sporotomaculum syntrophicum TaxID=182264 RepID=A0A9D2WP07_9FIRM|nr:Rho termination factor N-terminal domain-containing protein [Sporotomaculum syntrophicum]KAF1084724.1 hypothetical protein SPSYN_02510 [Sporotomaculum syntrophicum]